MTQESVRVTSNTTLASPRLAFTNLAVGVSATIGLSVLIGWAFDLPALRSLIPGAVQMKANAAVALLAASAALWLRDPPGSTRRAGASTALSALTLCIGGATLCEYAFGWQLGIDEWLVRDVGSAFNLIKGRMSPYTALSFCALGLGIGTLSRPGRSVISSLCGSLAAAIGLLSIVGYLWNAVEIVTDRIAPPVALNTAIALAFLGAALAVRARPVRAAAPAPARSRVEKLVLGGVVPATAFMLMGGGLIYESSTRFAQAAAGRRGITLVALLAILALLFAVFVLMLRGVRHEMRARADAEDALQGLNAELERRVAARTAELTHSQAFLRRVVDLDRNLIFAKDRAGRFVLANQALADLLGTTVEALMGKDERQFLDDAAAIDVFEAEDRNVIESGEELFQPEQAFTDRTGRQRWFESAKRPILSPDGTQTIVLGVAVEITGRLEAEREVRQLNANLERRVEERTRDLRESNALLRQARIDSEAATRAKSAFLANMSHEIRTPMNAVIGLTHLMLRETADRTQRERLGKVSEAAKHLLQVINDILDMSKIEAGKMTLESVEFSLDETLSGAMSMVDTQARAKGLELILDTDGLPDRLVGDPTRLSQILINLLSNAVKFTEHGWVRLRGRIEAEVGQRLELRFEVQDTGPGIALEAQAGLFGAFEQADASISRRHHGTGLGLALSRQLARAMGGDAGLASQPGSGSVFWVTAWLMRGARQPTWTASLKIEGQHCLLVDDLPEARNVIGDRLSQFGLRVDSVASGAAALAKAEVETAAGRPYDLMVIDWRMEPLDGIETLGRLRRLLGEGTPPAILVTAFDDDGLMARARESGFQAVVLKPVTHSSMQDALARLMIRSVDDDTLPPEVSDGEAELRQRHAGCRVLLAEDNPVNREVAEQLLESAGLVVETAWDGARAVEMALTRSYDLVLMDVQMPRMDGLEAAREIRSRAGHRLPIIAMTANAFSEDRQASLEAGMNDHLPKPVDPAQLYAQLLRWLPLRKPPSDDASSSAFGGLDADDLEARLATVEGIDIEAAMRNVAGRPSVLARAMWRFAQTYGEGLPALLDTSGDAADRRARWGVVCHSVRGALSAIGARTLLEQVGRLALGLERDEPVVALAAAGRDLHEQILALVAQLRFALQD